MGKQATAEMAEVEVTPKKAKKDKSLVDTVAEEMVPETPKMEKQSRHPDETAEEKLARKAEKRKRKQEEADAEAEAVEAETLKKEKRKKNKETEDEAMLEAAPEEDDEERRLRKEEKKKRKQAAAEAAAAAAAEQPAQDEAPTKKAKIESATAVADAEAPKTAAASPSSSGFTIYVGGLPTTCTNETLRKHFSACGKIKDIKVPGKKKGRGIAFMTFTNKEDLEKALKLNASDFEGRTLTVNVSGQRPEKEVKKKQDKVAGDSKGSSEMQNSALQVFVSGLPFQAEEATLRQHFGECGKIASFLLPLNKRNQPRGIAFITYATQEGFNRALARDGSEYEGRTLKVNKAETDKALKVKENPEKEHPNKEDKPKIDRGEVKSKPTGQDEEQGSSDLQVYVSGLPFQADEATLRKYFSACGEIASFMSPLNKRCQPRGQAFITFKTQDAMEKVLLRDGAEYEGRSLKVSRADVDKAPKVKANPEKGNTEKREKEEVKDQHHSSSTLQVYVGGLPFEADEATVRKTFAKCGEIVSFTKVVPKNPEKKPRGIAFITYKTKEAFNKALAFDGTDYEGKTLRVNGAGGSKGDSMDSTQKGKGGSAKGESNGGKGKGKDGKHKGKGKGDRGEGKGKGKGKGKEGKVKGKSKGKKGKNKDEDKDAARKLFDDCDEL